MLGSLFDKKIKQFLYELIYKKKLNKTPQHILTYNIVNPRTTGFSLVGVASVNWQHGKIGKVILSLQQN